MRAKSEGLHMQFRYSGERFRQYLQRNKISYKEAARILSIDKNTVGKAARGGNLKVDILLHICNVFQMDVTDFFICVITDKGGLAKNDYISSKLIKKKTECVLEDEYNCEKSKNYDISDHPLNEMIEELGNALSSLEKVFKECCEKIEAVHKKSAPDEEL